MPLQFTISPDLGTRQLTGWYVFNTWVQKALGLKVHFELYRDHEECRRAIGADTVDLIYANPYDASLLVRDKGFVPVAHPLSRPDEVVVAVAADSPCKTIEDLRAGMRIASSSDPEVKMIGLILLEPADIGPGNIEIVPRDSHVAIAKDLIRKQADAGFFMATSYYELSELTRKSLRVLLQSQIHVIHHMLLAGPRFAEHASRLQALLCSLSQDAKGTAMLQDLGIPGWQPTTPEEAEFMIDLMETLT